jgi:hypothetical protein
MGLDDGEWIRDEAAGPAGDQGTTADDGWPVGGWPEDSWPDDEWPGGAQPGGAQPGGAGKGPGHGGVPGFSVRVAAAVAVLAAAAGIATGLFLVKATPAASAVGGATPSASAPSTSAPAGSSTGLPGLPGLSGRGNALCEISQAASAETRPHAADRALAVSPTEILCLSGNGDMNPWQPPRAACRQDGPCR